TITLQGSGGANLNITLNDNGAAGVNYESFAAKYNSSGDLLWAKGGNSGSPKNMNNLETGQNGINQIVFDTSGNPYVAGFVSGTNFLGSSFINNGESEIVLARLNPLTGEIIWKQIIGGTKDDNGLDLKIDGSNNLYLVGNFGSPSITFPTTPATTFTNPDNPAGTLEDSTNTFIAKFNSSGSNLWVENLNNTETLGGSQIAVNGAGEIFLTGYYFDSATFPTVPETTLFETEGSGEGEASLGGYVTKLDMNGDFIWAKGFGGVGEAIALDGAGRVHVVGTFWDGGTFGGGTPNVETLASFGGEDLFVARYDSNGNFDWAKPIAASGFEGLIAIGNPSDPNGKTENNYNPLGIGYNPSRQTMFVSGDFQGAIALDCLTLTTPGNSLQSYLAELSGDTEAVSCRIWNGLDADDNNWDSTDNWNGGIVPNNNDSVYVPYTGNSFDNPTYNPAGNIIVNNLTVADDRTLTLERDLAMTGKLWLTGGIINAGADRLLDLTDTATANRIADADGSGGYVIGKIRKAFGNQNPFTFPVGTANGYSPVDVVPQSGIGATLTINAVQQAQPNAPSPGNRLNRYWTITKAGEVFITANLTFHYLQTDVVGNESTYRLFKIEENVPEMQTATIDTTANTATVNGISQFSDWTLGALAPTAAAVSISGRVITPPDFRLSNTLVTLTDSQGVSRTVPTGKFGSFRFNEVAAGETYILRVASRGYTFAPQIISPTENISGITFIPQ
ncbi:MAG: carboxypeptidase-like regulatory domain-containing protein, partial [Pyrinomonadaceae bacterium]|nr:carboxypeptidase-like regulatory domain-containing protein [Pyrinomonadaceae bacterium]